MHVPNEWQPRREFELESLNALAESIKEHGVVQPVMRPVIVALIFGAGLSILSMVVFGESAKTLANV